MHNVSFWFYKGIALIIQNNIEQIWTMRKIRKAQAVLDNVIAKPDLA